MTEEATRPARGYSWETFTAGNTAAVRHGAFSDRMVSARSAVVHAELVEACPWVIDTDAVAVDTWCRVRARFLMLSEYVETVVEQGGVGDVRPYLWSELARCETNLMKATESLGLDPAGRGKLARDLGMAQHFGRPGLAELGGQGRKLRQLRGRGDG